MPPAIKVKGSKLIPVETEQPNSFVRDPLIHNRQVYNNDTPTIEKIQTITLTGNLQETSPGSMVFEVTDGDAEINVDIA